MHCTYGDSVDVAVGLQALAHITTTDGAPVHRIRVVTVEMDGIRRKPHYLCGSRTRTSRISPQITGECPASGLSKRRPT